jgi:hypothetical protein
MTAVSRFASRTDEPASMRAGPRVTVAWSVRAGSINEARSVAFLAAQRVPAGTMIRLEVACDASRVRARLLAGEHELSLDELLGQDATIRWTRDAELTLDHVDATSSAGGVLRATLDASGTVRYASTSTLALLGLPGGRYELTR